MSVNNFSLIADIGGTNARFAMAETGSIQPTNIRNLAVDDFESIELAIKQYLDDLGSDVPNQCCIAIACPTHNDTISMTNNGWVFSKRNLQDHFGIEQLSVINDYAAMAYAAANWKDDQLIKVGRGEPLDDFPIAVLGAGTGLGVSGLVRSGGATIPLVTEGGHVDFAPTTEQEVAILRWLLKRYERVSAERLVSGMGIQNIYQALAELRGSPVERMSPAEISRLAFEERDQFALETLEQFCKIYGSVAGNLALSYGAQGGVFVTGGIVPKMLDFFIESGFRQRFEAKGRFDQYMASIPTYVMTAEEPGLIGAAAALV